ncbi:hypothetical protein PACTADRAFT_49050 [Pachysolen tannophilus NRRL Y-2460]|uniref:Mitochondrial phosphate carrier protein 2 n=1 Tax=Pachysolen tannophilus NRRL Y-2460 TaxID=669874 RepID=A0A1E4U002_PACTA|nr:hypothetical protein PACTADRAFT_49050 [Pachysolen tannophilus NRRL Y-2460]
MSSFFPSSASSSDNNNNNNNRNNNSKVTIPSGYWIKQSIEKAAESVKPAEKRKIELYSGEYYATCTVGGILACAPTHSGITPLDLVKCRRQVNASLYKSNIDGFKKIFAADGFGGLYTGFGATLIGYGLQGAGKYGFYEYFKKTYSDLAGPSFVENYNTIIFLAASASAEFLADLALCPFESIKVRTQTTLPPYASSVFDGWRKFVAKDGFSGLYKGLVPLWCRQIPYTMVKFSSFEKIVEAIYARLPTKKSEMSVLAQTGVSFTGGYIAGIFCATVSHPADVLVSQVSSTGKSIGTIYKQIGFTGLWNGLPMRIVMIGTLTGFQWLIYDSFKVFVGLPTTGGH